MVRRLLLGIFAAVFLPLGIVFTAIGVAADGVDSGTPEGFVYTGLAALAVGLACLGGFLVLRGREADRRVRRRTGRRARAQIVEARFQGGIRVGAWLTYDLTVTFDPAGTVSRRLLVVPGTRLVAGETIEVLYDPADPSNFEPAP